MTVTRGAVQPYSYQPVVLRDGKRVPQGKATKLWKFSVTVAGKQVRRTGFATKAEAEVALANLRDDTLNPAPAIENAPSMTLGEGFDRFWSAKSSKKSLREDRRQSVHILRDLGDDTPLVELTAARIAEWRDRRKATPSARTSRKLEAASVNRPLALLRTLLNLAHDEWGTLPEVPKIRLEKEPEGKLRWLTPEEATRLLTTAAASRNPDILDMIELAMFTGMRLSEVLGLTWDRVDRSRGVVLLEVTKSGKRREVPLNARADAALARRGPKASGRVFRSARWDSYRTAFETAIEKAKLLAPLTFHDLRHTFASWAVQRRVSLLELRDLLGHASLAMVQRYAHLAPDHLRGAVAALDDVLPAFQAAPAPAHEPARTTATR
jgi:integrase